MIAGELLQGIETFADAVELCKTQQLMSPEQAQELTGFGLLPGKHKELLLGVPFLIICFDFRVGHDNSSFVECPIVTTHNDKYLLRDSSKGIYVQLSMLYKERLEAGEARPFRSHYVRKGLTFQDHNYITASGESSMSRTYYLTDSVR
jgi:hypothetical protein